MIYVQYTNPASYPPLEHSSLILATSGWKVVFLGTGARGAGKLEFSAHPNIQVKRWRFVEGGVLQKIHYILFGLWCCGYALMWRPNWIYASDPLICPIALVIQRITGAKLVYHEHDSPDSEDRG